MILYKNSGLMSDHVDQSPTYFWHELVGITDANNQPKFGLLSKFMRDLLVLPHSSASVERLLSNEYDKDQNNKTGY